MPKRPVPGDRVGVIYSYDHNTVNLVGYGEYVGDLRPLSCFGQPTDKEPKIILDGGRAVFCSKLYWHKEEVIKEFVEEFPYVVNVDENGNQLQ